MKTCCLIYCSRRIPRLQAPRQLKTLEDLLAQAVHYATFCMRNSGKMAPAFFLIGADGPLMFATGSLADEDERDAFASNARLGGWRNGWHRRRRGGATFQVCPAVSLVMINMSSDVSTSATINALL